MEPEPSDLGRKQKEEEVNRRGAGKLGGGADEAGEELSAPAAEINTSPGCPCSHHLLPWTKDTVPLTLQVPQAYKTLKFLHRKESTSEPLGNKWYFIPLVVERSRRGEQQSWSQQHSLVTFHKHTMGWGGSPIFHFLHVDPSAAGLRGALPGL